MQSLLNDCQKLRRRTTPIFYKKPIDAIKKLYHASEIKERISEVKEEVLKAEAEFQVSPPRLESTKPSFTQNA